ncbi:MAG: secondary thiamine-phosphate synthase enzyme YjbQ [Candidatus Hydrogenedentes bacterium]|nr:secondary thiamine-phosphate synthase enzyme YjbQ [Candidatus Hydrogenedentota bacterium]
MKIFTLKTNHRTEFINIDKFIKEALNESDLKEGIVCVYVPHTTAGVTINENADPDVVHDLAQTLDLLIPWNGKYRHSEGNSPAHVKASLIGSSVQLIVHKGDLVLGTWQSVYFCEFDGPRTRKFYVKIIKGE